MCPYFYTFGKCDKYSNLESLRNKCRPLLGLVVFKGLNWEESSIEALNLAYHTRMVHLIMKGLGSVKML